MSRRAANSILRMALAGIVCVTSLIAVGHQAGHSAGNASADGTTSLDGAASVAKDLGVCDDPAHCVICNFLRKRGWSGNDSREY